MRKERETNIQVRQSKKTVPNVNIDDFIQAYQAKSRELGIVNESVISTAIVEAIEHCNKFEHVNLEELHPINLKFGMSNKYSNKGILDLVAVVSKKNKDNTFKSTDENGSVKFSKYSTIVVSDGEWAVDSMPIFCDRLRELVIEKTKVVQKLIVRGFFVPVLQKNKTYETFFYVLTIFDYEGNYRAYGFTDDEIKEAQKIINVNKHNLRLYLMKEIKRLLQVKNLKENPQLKICLENAVLQSLSSRTIRRHNGWIHSIVWGPPSTGKNFIVQVIKLLNLEFREGQSGKITIAGLLSACSSKEGKYVAEPGLLVLANGGVFVIQDFHSVEDVKKKLFFGIISKVAQEGEAIDSTASKTTYKILTGIHLDANKISQIRLSKEKSINVFEDYGIEIQILSRFDFIMDIKVDAHTRYKTARASLGNIHDEEGIQKSERLLKIIIAILKDRFPKIQVSNDVIAEAQKRIDAFYYDNIDTFGRVDVLSDFPQRMMMSFHKYLNSIARLNCRAYSKVEDVEYAMKFLSSKLEFLKNYAPELQTDSMLGKSQKTRICKQYLVDYFQDDYFTISNAVNVMKKSDNLTVSRNISERTVRRYVESVATQVKRDTWKINESLLRK